MLQDSSQGKSKILAKPLLVAQGLTRKGISLINNQVMNLYLFSERKLLYRLILPGGPIVYSSDLNYDRLNLSSEVQSTVLFKLRINLLFEIIKLEVVQERQA